MKIGVCTTPWLSLTRPRRAGHAVVSVLSSLNSSMVILYQFADALRGEQHGVAVAEEAVFCAIACA
jgi:hypothetical protein